MIGMRFYLEVAAAVALFAGFWAWNYHERQVGAVSVEAQDTKAVTAQAQKDAHTLANDQSVVRQETETYARAINQAITAAPVVSVCIEPQAPALLPAAPAGDRPHPHGPADVRSPGAPVPAVEHWHTDPLVQVGHDADAQIAGLQDYIASVCPTL